MAVVQMSRKNVLPSDPTRPRQANLDEVQKGDADRFQRIGPRPLFSGQLAEGGAHGTAAGDEASDGRDRCVVSATQRATRGLLDVDQGGAAGEGCFSLRRRTHAHQQSRRHSHDAALERVDGLGAAGLLGCTEKKRTLPE
jgi:hypothetical protein